MFLDSKLPSTLLPGGVENVLLSPGETNPRQGNFNINVGTVD